jgi:hypothetical protein
MIKITKKDELYVRINCERYIENEIYEEFSFFIPRLSVYG